MLKLPMTSPLSLSLLALPIVLGQYTATYTPGSLPDHSQEGQSGTNNCGTTASQTSMCQNAYINSVDDFCLWGPPSTHSDEGDGTSKIGNVEQNVVRWVQHPRAQTDMVATVSRTAMALDSFPKGPSKGHTL